MLGACPLRVHHEPDVPLEGRSAMRTIIFVATAVVMLALPWSAASASGPMDAVLLSDNVTNPGGARAETLWIFDADFEDLIGDNAGWIGSDRSGTLAVANHWHKDTIRINGFEHLGDSTWWCGMYDPCWRQPRGYGNNWVDCLERDFPLSSWSGPGDEVAFEWDQRYAMEHDYDYGYFDVSTDGGENWDTIDSFTNPGFAYHPGFSQDWDSTMPGCEGHQVQDLSAYAGMDVRVRFRFESDQAYSAQDNYNNPPTNSVLDGAWQLDNFTWTAGGTVYWQDDCESPGDNGWEHDEIPATGQAGVAFERRFESFAGRTGWMMAAYDTTSGGMVDGQSSVLRSPPIGVAGAPALVGRWEGYLDMPGAANDLVSMWVGVSDIPECVDPHGAIEPAWWPTFGGPFWMEMEQNWGAYLGRDWLGLELDAWNHEPSTSHGVGFVLDRVRIGVPLETGVPDEGATGVRLARAHPNPFGQRTTIGYSISTRAHVTARVVDVSGRVVRTLIDRTVEPGEHSLVWDGRTDSGERVASGVYFVRLESVSGRSSEEATRKLILLD